MVSEGKRRERRREGRTDEEGITIRKHYQKKSPRAQEIGRQIEMEGGGKTDRTRAPQGTAQFVGCKTTGTG